MKKITLLLAITAFQKRLLIITAALLSNLGAFAQIVDGGTTGQLTWEISGPPNNYTLTISGSGAMPDYAHSNDAPWYGYISRTGRNKLHMEFTKWLEW